MDGYQGDRIDSGKLLRLASQSQAMENYVDTIFYLIRGKDPSVISSVDGNILYFYYCSRPQYLLTEDHLKCVSIAKKVKGTLIFPSEYEAEIEAKIRSFIEVEFSDRRKF